MNAKTILQNYDQFAPVNSTHVNLHNLRDYIKDFISSFIYGETSENSEIIKILPIRFKGNLTIIRWARKQVIWYFVLNFQEMRIKQHTINIFSINGNILYVELWKQINMFWHFTFNSFSAGINNVTLTTKWALIWEG